MQINQAKIAAQTQGDIQKMQAQMQQHFTQMQKEQEQTLATLSQKHDMEMASLRAEMTTKLTIAAWSDDQKRDAANQQYAVDAKKVALDNETKLQVARENASNQVGAE
jgi:predicted transcriptional regulator